MSGDEKNIDIKKVAEKIRSISNFTQTKALLKYHGSVPTGGIVVGMGKSLLGGEIIRYIDDDTHSVCIGATRSGKSRTVVLQSIGVQALAGECIVSSDPKGELYQYTYPFLERLGYKIYTIDFKNPLKSNKYNFLQNVIDAVNAKDIPRAIDVAWDITTALVGETKGERIWNDGEASVIASGILAVVYDSRNRPEYQNLTNVYYFISEMCRQFGEYIPINDYMDKLMDNHPAKALMGISGIAPEKTRGSFFTAALTTLRLFTNPYIYNMTRTSDFDSALTADEKTAIFMILPDEKSTYYSLAALFVNQYYEVLVNVADKRGGRLKRRVNFNLDEFGNFIPIPMFTTKLTVGGGRGIRFNLFVQSVAQLEEKYSKTAASTILGNCQTWLYLRSGDPETLEIISKKLGNYTVAANSHSTSYNGSGLSPGSMSASDNLAARALLTPDEVGKIDRPYTLVVTQEYPAVLYAPDLSQTFFNTMFGLGDKDHNTSLRQRREQLRKVFDYDGKMELWGIWKEYRPKSAAPELNKIESGKNFKKKEGNNFENIDDKVECTEDNIVYDTVPNNGFFEEFGGG